MVELDSRDIDFWIRRVEEVDGGGEEEDCGGEEDRAAEAAEERRARVAAIRS